MTLRNGKSRSNDVSSVAFPESFTLSSDVLAGDGHFVESELSSPPTSAPPENAVSLHGITANSDELVEDQNDSTSQGQEAPEGAESTTGDASVVPQRHGRSTKKDRTDADGFVRPIKTIRRNSVSNKSDSSRISGPVTFPTDFDQADKSLGFEPEGWQETVRYHRYLKAAVASMKRKDRKKVLRRARVMAKYESSRPKERLHSEKWHADKKKAQGASPEPVAGPSYFEKGKMRAQDVEGTDLAQLDRDREVAERLHESINGPGSHEPTPAVTIREPKKSKAERKQEAKDRSLKFDKKKKSKASKTTLDLNRIIESPVDGSEANKRKSQTPMVGLIGNSKDRVMGQLPQNGFLWKTLAKKSKGKNAAKKKKRSQTPDSSSEGDSSSSSSSPESTPPSESGSTSSEASEPSESGDGNSDPSSSNSSSEPDSDSSDTDSETSSSTEDSSYSVSSDDEGDSDPDKPYVSQKTLQAKVKKAKRALRAKVKAKAAKKAKKASKSKSKPKSSGGRSVKYPEPSSYDGRAKLEAFETFVFEFTNWIKMSKVPSKHQMIVIKRFLTGKAGDHYMTFAAVNLKRYDVESYLKALFNHCFPIYFRRKMRDQFMNCVQGGRTTREFLRELRTLGNRLPDVNEIQIRLRFWEGANQYLRIEWSKCGVDPESTSLDTMEVLAERFEDAEQFRRVAEKKGANEGNNQGNQNSRKGKDRQRGNGGGGRGNGDRPSGQNGQNDRNDRQGQKSHKSTRFTKSDYKGKSKLVKPDKGPKHTYLTDAEKKVLYDGKQCYECKKVGHMARDCPQKTTLGSMTFVELEQLAEAEREGRTLSLGSINPEANVDFESPEFLLRLESDERQSRMNRELIQRVEVQLNANLPYPGDEHGETITGDRWEISVSRTGRMVIVYDRVMNDIFQLEREYVESPHGSIGRFLQDRRRLQFESAALNDDVITANLIATFERDLNDPSGGLIDTHADPDGVTRWRVHSSDFHSDLVIVDQLPHPHVHGYDSSFRLSRSEILNDDFDVVAWVHEEIWVRQRILDTFTTANIDLDVEMTADERIDPWSHLRWTIWAMDSTMYRLEDRVTRADFYLSRENAFDTSFDILEWMNRQQALAHARNPLLYMDDEEPAQDEQAPTGDEVTPNGETSETNDDHSESSDNIWPGYENESNGQSSQGPENDPWYYARYGDGDTDWGQSDDIPGFSPASWDVNYVEPGPSNVPTTSNGHHSDGPPGLAMVSGSEDESEELDRGRPDPNSVSEILRRMTLDGRRRSASVGTIRRRQRSSERSSPIMNGVTTPNGRTSSPASASRPPSGAHMRDDEESQSDHEMSDEMVEVEYQELHLAAADTTRRPMGKKILDRLERNAARGKDITRLVPTALVVDVKINGVSTRALVDSGSLADFMSTKLADQLKLTTSQLAKPMAVQLAVTGSRTIVNSSVVVDLQYQEINERRRFDIINLENYDLILGTPFLYQHKIGMAFNPSKLVVGSAKSVPMEGEQVAVIPSRAADLLEGELEKIRTQLKKEARDLCKGVGETSLPPLREVNHEIPLIDPSKVHSWRPSKCPEAMKPLWHAKRDEYLKSGRWRYAVGVNSSPMLILWKPKVGPDGKQKIRTVVDKRQQNENTKKLASPLPDMENMLRNAAKHKYRSLMDGKDAYEQIRVLPEHVPRTLFNTPDGTMESLVLQQGDCNGGATYQSLMNHIFSSYIGVWMDVYLDDILIYSNTIEEHIAHIRTIFDVLRREKLYLSADKMDLFARELKILGFVVNDQGIRMDPHKVDTVVNWKVPTSKELLSGFIGSVGYLATGIANVRIPMAVLTPLTGSDRTFRWGATEQRAFDEIKRMVEAHRNKSRVSIDYSPGAPPINLTCDASLTGAGGHVSQGDDPKTAKNVAFWSGKFNSAQQNYPTHERELLAIVESLKRFRHLLMGCRFRIYTDHKSLEHLMRQKNLSPRQARWLEVLCEFDYEVRYIPGEDNVLSDALSRMYSEEPSGVKRAPSEFVAYEDGIDGMRAIPNIGLASLNGITTPLYTAEPDMVAVTEEAVPEPEGEPIQTRRSSRIKVPTKRPDADHDRLYKKKPIPKKKVPLTTIEEVTDVDSPRKAPAGIETTEPKILEPLLTPIAPKIVVTPPQIKVPDMEPIAKQAKLIAKDVVSDQAGLPELRLPEAPALITDNELIAPPHLNDELAAPPQLNDPKPEPFPSIVAACEGIDVYDHIRNQYGSDEMFKNVFVHPTHFRNFEVHEGLLYLKEKGVRLLCVPDIKVGDRRMREILITHAHTLLAHLGSKKTYHFLRAHVWWRGLYSDVEAYCDSCGICAGAKSRTAQPFGLLKSLEVPTRPWQVMGVDFVGPLPESKNRHGTFDMMVVFIDHLTSMVHIAPTTQKYRAKHMAELVFDVVYKHHGLPEAIVSDRDKIFTSTFWSRLHELIGTELRLSSAYHPQTDGATERANKTITQALRQCVSPNQKDWVIKLPAIEFAINSARSDTTGFSPFYLIYGRVPDAMIWETEEEYPGVRVFAQRMKDALMCAHDAVISARVKQTTSANKHRREAPFVEGDLVYLSTANLSLPKKRARKLVPKFIGPYRILREIVKGASFELDLPAELKQRGIHPVFHSSLLRVHVPNDDRRFPGRQIRQLTAFEGSPTEWAVDCIITHYGKGRDAVFKLKWKSGDVTWADYRTVSKLDAIKHYCDLIGVSDASHLPDVSNEVPEDVQLGCATLAQLTDDELYVIMMRSDYESSRVQKREWDEWAEDFDDCRSSFSPSSISSPSSLPSPSYPRLVFDTFTQTMTSLPNLTEEQVLAIKAHCWDELNRHAHVLTKSHLAYVSLPAEPEYYMDYRNGPESNFNLLRTCVESSPDGLRESFVRRAAEHTARTKRAAAPSAQGYSQQAPSGTGGGPVRGRSYTKTAATQTAAPYPAQPMQRNKSVKERIASQPNEALPPPVAMAEVQKTRTIKKKKSRALVNSNPATGDSSPVTTSPSTLVTMGPAPISTDSDIQAAIDDSHESIVQLKEQEVAVSKKRKERRKAAAEFMHSGTTTPTGTSTPTQQAQPIAGGSKTKSSQQNDQAVLKMSDTESEMAAMYDVPDSEIHLDGMGDTEDDPMDLDGFQNVHGPE